MDKTIQGTICSPVQVNTSKNGKYYAKFDVKIKTTIVPCIAWTHLCPDMDFDSLSKSSLDTLITVKGFLPEKKQKDLFTGEEKNAVQEFVVKWFRIGTKKEAKPLRDRLVEWAGGEDGFKRDQGEVQEYMKAGGFVHAKITDSISGWQPKELCIKHEGVWKYRVQYLSEVLGPKLLNEEIKEFRRHLSTMGLKGFPSEKFDEKISELVKTAEFFSRVI